MIRIKHKWNSYYCGINFHLQTKNSECLPSQKSGKPFKMAGVTIQQVQGDKLRSFTSTRNQGIGYKPQEESMQSGQQRFVKCYNYNEINNDSNIIPYLQYLQESQDASIQDTTSSEPNDLLVLSLVEQMTDHVANLDKENQTNKMVNESLIAELERYKE
ncbi:hypothetical protein Tco_1374637 [Tanacetum coccineum]